ncbi:hypothetical protein Avbf_01373 [Armadillidium vulgare]|nr:hypothetical protein Avbf_01373 [Armadillidium vulgare]
MDSSTNSTSSDKAKYKWWIPITYTSQPNPSFENTSTKVWMSPSETTKTIQNAAIGNWIIVNLNQVGYYRVNYDNKNWKDITEQLSKDPNVFPAANRAQIIDDSCQLAKAGLLSNNISLELLKYLHKEPMFAPLKAALRNLKFFRKYVHVLRGLWLL